MYENLCEPWDYVWCGSLTGIDPAVTGTALLAASEVLWEATGRRFGNCAVTVRPCRQDCQQFPIDARFWNDASWSRSGWPWPALIDGEWLNLACGVCQGDCSCTSVSEVLLPETFWRIESVVVDDVPLVSGADYVIYDGQRLVRTGADWPLCQDWSKTSGPGTWFITARFGEPVPALGKQAVGVLALELARACMGEECGLPVALVTQVTRQGVTFQRSPIADLLDKGLTGLWIPDRFISTYNPHGIMDRARVYSPDVTYPRTQP